MEGGPERSALFFSKKEKKSIHLRLFGIYYEHLASASRAKQEVSANAYLDTWRAGAKRTGKLVTMVFPVHLASASRAKQEVSANEYEAQNISGGTS